MKENVGVEMGKIVKLLKGGVISLIIFIAITAIFGLLMRFTGLPERFAWLYLLAAITAACGYMGLYSGNLFQRRGLLVGAVFSALIASIILIGVALAFSEKLTPEILTPWYLIPVCGGGLLGAAGANLKN